MDYSFRASLEVVHLICYCFSETGYRMQEQVNKVVRRKKNEDGGFSYSCCLSEFECEGRKGILQYLKEKHPTEFFR